MTSSLESATIQLLRAAGFTFAHGEGGSLVIPARVAAIGDLVVAFEDNEVSVFLGNITYCHFTPYSAYDEFPGCTAEQAATNAVHFIREVVEDKWVIWRWSDGRGGCFKPDGDDSEAADAPLPGEEVERFLWSGPYVPSNNRMERPRER